MDDTSTCVIGDHEHPGTTAICERHLAAAQVWLSGVAAMTRQLTYHLTPNAGQKNGDKVSTSRTGSPTPAPLAVLSLVGPGVTEIRRDRRSLVRQVRRWSTLETVDVHVVRDGQVVVERRTIREFHRELVVDRDGRPVLVPLDDQVGQIPPAEWADLWVRRWRLQLQHTTTGIRGRVDLACDAEQRMRLHAAASAEQLRMAAGHPNLLPAVAAYLHLQARYAELAAAQQHQARNAVLGLGAAVRADPARRRPDAVVAELQLRFGGATTAAATAVDTAYLAQWLEAAAEHPDADVDAFFTELRALHAELERVLGYVTDTQWIGRCPTWQDDDTGRTDGRYCGRGIWHDPLSDDPITCSRCHTSWEFEQWAPLADLILDVWPIDFRRRYREAERDRAEHNHDRMPACQGCERPLRAEWCEDTRRRDREPMWRPVRLVCPAGCLSGGTSRAA